MSLPRGAIGVGLRAVHHGAVNEGAPRVDYLEIIAENYLGLAEPPRRALDRARERFPVAVHGVGLNLLGASELDSAHLDRLAALAESVDAPFVSDHLCWTGSHGATHHELLPLPMTAELVDFAAERARFVARHLGRPFALENLSSYVSFPESTLDEWSFYTEVIAKAGCLALLDVNNVYVSSVNHGFDPSTYLAAVDFSRVAEVHLAGHTRRPDGSLLDTHDAPVCDAVWALYREAWQLAGEHPFPTLIEWDDALPSFDELCREAERAREARR